MVAPAERRSGASRFPRAPGIIAAALVIFVLAVSEFGVPGLLRVRVYTTESSRRSPRSTTQGGRLSWLFRCWPLCLVVAVAAVAFGRRSPGDRPARSRVLRQSSSTLATPG